MNSNAELLKELRIDRSARQAPPPRRGLWVGVAIAADATEATSKGAIRETVPVISIIRRTPVRGALTTAVKNAAMPTMA